MQFFVLINSCSNLFSNVCFSNRQNERVYDAFRVVLGDELIVDHDRLGVMRPSLVRAGDGDSTETKVFTRLLTHE